MREAIMGAEILVVGDVAIDWFEQATRPADLPERTPFVANHVLLPGFSWTPRPGGAWLLRRLVSEAVSGTSTGWRVHGHLEIDPTDPAAQHFLHSLTRLGQRPNSTWSVTEFRGFSIPSGDKSAATAGFPQGLNGSCDIVVVDDAANGCRWDRKFIDAVKPYLSQAKLVILKLHRPLDTSPFPEFASKTTQQVLIIINADDLRAHGVDISRRTSWERTARDIRRAKNSHPILQRLVGSSKLLVRLGCDGCVVVGADEFVELIFDPIGTEGEHILKVGGALPGETSAFTAGLLGWLTASIADEETTRVLGAIEAGLQASRRLHELGFVMTDNRPNYPTELFTKGARSPFVQKRLTLDGSTTAASLLGDALRAEPKLARRIVTEGPARSLCSIPTTRYRQLLLADQREIEGYRSIENLLREYLATPMARPRPLSIGVFGQPGSGKSFGITELASAVGIHQLVPKVVNMTQIERPRELVGIFHDARDTGLRGDLPMLIFDEFDCLLDGKPFGWLKHFLAVMHEGEFLDEGRLHPLGRSILVFAGGVAQTYDDLRKKIENGDVDFVNVKGPDFVSRLKGHLDILGINPDENSTVDSRLQVRRALLLWTVLRAQGTRTEAMFPIVGGEPHLQIDAPVVDAFLEVERYRFGVRSLEALVAISQLSGKPRFEVACLPSDTQLLQHVDESFLFHLRPARVAA